MRRQSLSFSSQWLSTVLAASAADTTIDDAIVVNLATRPMMYEAVRLLVQGLSRSYSEERHTLVSDRLNAGDRRRSLT